MEKVKTILQTLRQELKLAHYPPGSRFPSEYDLALRFDVNKATANKAVAVLVAAGLLVRGSRGQGTRVATLPGFTGGLIAFIGNVKHSYYARVLHGIQDFARAHDSMVGYFAPTAAELDGVLSRLRGAGVRGIITHGYGRLDSGTIPTLYVDMIACYDTGDCNIITSDNYQGGRDTINALLAHGHRDIVIYWHHSLMPDRLRGYGDAMAAAGIGDFRQRCFPSVELSEFDARNFLQKARRKFPAFTAIVTGSDNNLQLLLPELRRQFPERHDKIALAGFGNLPELKAIRNVLSVDQHPFRVGARAAELLLGIIEHGQPAAPIREQLEVELTGVEHIPEA